MRIVIYTDGSITGNGKPEAVGGWACIIQAWQDGQLLGEKELSGAKVGTTSNEMELTAIYEGLKALDPAFIGTATVDVFSDSQYSVNALTTYLKDWKMSGWKTAQGTPVANQKLIQSIDHLKTSWNANIQWVKGHAGNELNERCDELAKKAKVTKMEEIKSKQRILTKSDIYKLVDRHLRDKGFTPEEIFFDDDWTITAIGSEV